MNIILEGNIILKKNQAIKTQVENNATKFKEALQKANTINLKKIPFLRYKKKWKVRGGYFHEFYSVIPLFSFIFIYMILRRFKFYSDRMNEEGLEQREYSKFGTTVSALKRHIGRDLANAKLLWKAGKAAAGNKALSLNPKEVTQAAANTRLIAQRGGNVGVFKMYPKKYQQVIAKDAASKRPFFDAAAKNGHSILLYN